MTIASKGHHFVALRTFHLLKTNREFYNLSQLACNAKLPLYLDMSLFIRKPTSRYSTHIPKTGTIVLCVYVCKWQNADKIAGS